MALSRLQRGTERGQASLYYARERRASLAGVPNLFRTHYIRDTAALPVAPIDPSAIFSSRDVPVTFKTAVQINNDNPGVHDGLVFEMGGSSRGVAIWLDTTQIGFVAGGTGDNGALAIFNNGAELPVGEVYHIVAAIRMDGRIRLWLNGEEAANATTVDQTDYFDGPWVGTTNGSFASDPQGASHVGVPGNVDQAPDGFDVIEPLSIYLGQVPRHFV